MAANAARHLNNNYSRLSRSIERLSSGKRLNRASDDAAGLGVLELMRVDMAIFKQGARNAMDGISMLQTMEGALDVINEALVRMEQLAEQASTGSYSSAQRAIMQNEFDEMRLEIDRIAGGTKFNGIAMLNTTGTVSIHFGKLTSDKLDIIGSDVTSASSGLNISGLTIHKVSSAKTALPILDAAITTQNSARAKFGYKMNRLESTVSVLNIQHENVLIAKDRVSSIDVATEVAEMTRTQVLAQAGVAMLVQANTIPQMALTLLA